MRAALGWILVAFVLAGCSTTSVDPRDEGAPSVSSPSPESSLSHGREQRTGHVSGVAPELGGGVNAPVHERIQVNASAVGIMLTFTVRGYADAAVRIQPPCAASPCTQETPPFQNGTAAFSKASPPPGEWRIGFGSNATGAGSGPFAYDYEMIIDTVSTGGAVATAARS